MSILRSVSVDDIISRGSIREQDVMRMRQSFYDDGLITPEEADQLIRLNAACPVQDAAWSPFVVQAICDYIVNQTEPEGYVTAANADWLIAMIAPEGRVRSKTELDLLLQVLDTARWSPERLVRFALDEVKRAIIEGDGPLRMNGTRQTGTITDAEVDLIRRILYAFGGDGNIAITRAEAEVLIAIEESLATGGTPNPAWTDLFVKAMANVILATSGYAPPSREEALRSDAWLKRRGDLAPSHMVGAMVTGSLSSVWDTYTEQSSEERALARLERQRVEIITNEEITEGEAFWLVERMTRDDRLTPTELALIDYLRREATMLHPALVDLVRRTSAA
ncbi:MAG: hypothetical protein B7Y80_14830 [Hyphomicrobium sp. 32-62-53]|nr:MAG: hypothetical protein B7Z29_15635 [Hyphomicrobium sp. 12-62-95]OYX98604.1 MAG: hypothetical protein B7Y80_14830 [Hyphomicrobium sp. 32-62-53]